MNTAIAIAASLALLTAGSDVLTRGEASWYGTGSQGHAAAGPAIRQLPGPWRGMRVRVCRKGTCVRVRLTDWCRCPGRVIDLNDADFRRLAPLWRGVINVNIR